MPDITLLNPGNSVENALFYITAMDAALITASSATQIVLTDGNGLTYTLAGAGFTTAVINGVTYINSGTVDSIVINNGAGDIYQFTTLAMAGTTLRDAMQADFEGSNQRALETLFLRLTWTITGTPVADVHTAGDFSSDGYALTLTRNNTYLLGDGNDTVTGAGRGNDTIYGGTGQDLLNGIAGNDVLYGEGDDDGVFGGAGDDSVYGGTGNDVVDGGDGNDVLGLAETGSAFGGAGNDTLTGGSADCDLYGDAGDDSLSGAASNSRLYGGTGNDILQGAAQPGPKVIPTTLVQSAGPP